MPPLGERAGRLLALQTMQKKPRAPSTLNVWMAASSMMLRKVRRELCSTLKLPQELCNPLTLDQLCNSDAMIKCADWDWSEDEASWAGCPETEEAVRADHAAAMDWYRQARLRGEDIHPVSLEAPSFPSSKHLAKKSVTSIV